MIRGFGLNQGETAALISKLRREHAELDRRIQEFDRHPWLSADDQLERTRLKKMKLATKDQIERLSRSPTAN